MSLSKIFDNILLQSGIFLLSFVWLRYYISDNWLCLLITVLIAGIINILIMLLFKKRKIEKSLKKNDSLKMKALKKFIVLNGFSLKELFEKKGYVVFENNNYLLIEKESIQYAVFLEFSISPLTKEKTISLYLDIAKLNVNKMIIFSNGVKSDINDVLEYIDVELALKDLTYLYQQLKEFDILPKLEEVKTKKKLFPKFLIIIFNKSRSKYYLLSGIFLLLSSLLIFTPIYYIIFASILILLSVYSKYNKKFNMLLTDI